MADDPIPLPEARLRSLDETRLIRWSLLEAREVVKLRPRRVILPRALVPLKPAPRVEGIARPGSHARKPVPHRSARKKPGPLVWLAAAAVAAAVVFWPV